MTRAGGVGGGMEIAVGLPTTLAIDGTAVVEWARRAEARGFSALATIDRIVYPNYDSLTALAAAAGATSRIGLVTDILLTPAYPPAWLAKATGSLHALSGGRLTLGLGVGGREDDFAAMDRPFGERGRLMDETLETLHRAWAGESGLSPAVPGGKVPILVGGNGPAAMRRTVRWGEGWTIGGAPPAQAAEAAEKVRAAWRDGGREGEPKLAALGYFGFGDDAALARSLKSYYAFLGDAADFVVANAVKTPDEARQRVADFANAGFTQLVLDPAVADLDQVDRLADAVL
jgi:alkanesulfonate monooxygenase SsuD/methylene tetrahydromethanopterin reductase-like flavin-dependent oxidoreductase (luciferase family)